MFQVTILACTAVTFMFCVSTTFAKAKSPASLPQDTILLSDNGGNHEVLQSHTVPFSTQPSIPNHAQYLKQVTYPRLHELGGGKYILSRRDSRSSRIKASRRDTRSNSTKASRRDMQSWPRPVETEEDTKDRHHITKQDSFLLGKGEEVRRSDLQSRSLQDGPNVAKQTQHVSNMAVLETVTSSIQRDFESDGQYTRQPSSELIPGHNWLDFNTSSHKKASEGFTLPLDLSRCGGGHCSCSNSTSGKVYARCSDRGLQPVSEGAGPLFPAALYSFVIANQHMKQVPLERLLPYKNLRTVDASGNSLKRLSFAGINSTMPLHTLDLSRCGISTIDCSYFSHMPNLKRLSLRRNNIGSVDRCTFLALHDLEYLDLSMNHIQTLTDGSFETLVNLKALFLYNNHFSYLKQLTPAIFRPLQRLQVLQIHASNQADTYLYPDKALSTLSRLRELSIDGLFHAKFGPPMKTLTQLTVLNFGHGQAGKCQTRQITSDFFANLPYLRSLTIGHCDKLESISTHAFDPLPHLEVLVFSDLVYSLKQLLSQLSGLRNSSIRKLKLSGIHNHTRASLESACHFLGETDASNLREMTGLQELDLSHNRLNVILHSFVALLPKSLQHLNLSNNMLTPYTSILIQGQSLSNLTFLDEANQLKVKDQSWGHNLAQSCRNQGHPRRSTSWKHQRKYVAARGGRARESGDNIIKEDNAAVTAPGGVLDLKYRHKGRSAHDYASLKQSGERSGVSKNCHTQFDADDSCNTEVPMFKSQVPPKLIAYTASGSYNLGTVFLGPNIKTNSLKLLNVSNTYLNNWGSRYRLSPLIEIADFSINYCDTLRTHFLTPGNSLREAYLQQNILGNTFTQDKGSALRYFNNVTLINLSQNFIHYLSRDSMKGLVSAQYIDLSNNRLQMFNVRLEHMASLRVLDLSMNLLEWISLKTRNDLDTIALNHSVFLNLYPNPFKCTCSSIELLQWLATTKVRVLSKDFMFCYDENKRKQKIGDFSERVRQLQRSCTSEAYVIVLTASSITVTFFVIGAGLLFRYRWKFIYWKNVTLAKYYGFQGGGRGQEVNAPRFTFDVYVLYSQEDRNFVLQECLKELETKRGHRLCVEDRDFMFGSYMPGVITSAVQNSAHTMPVMSPDFIEEGDWCEYGLHMASMESLHSGRALLHPLLLHPVPHDDMPKDLLKSLQANQYSEYPPEEAGEDVRQTFWDALSRTLGHVDVVEEGVEGGGQR